MTAVVPILVVALVVFIAGVEFGRAAEARDHARRDRIRRELEAHRGDR